MQLLSLMCRRKDCGGVGRDIFPFLGFSKDSVYPLLHYIFSTNAVTLVAVSVSPEGHNPD